MDNRREVNSTESMAGNATEPGFQQNMSTNTPLASSSKENETEGKIRLILLIVMLIAGAFVIVFAIVNFINTKREIVGWSEQDEKVSEIRETIGQAYEANGSVEELVNNYNKEIESVKANEDYSLMNRLIYDRSFDLYYYGYCNMAIESLENGDINMFPPETLAEFYSGAKDIALSCEDDEHYRLWLDLYDKTVNGLELVDNEEIR